MKVEVAWITPNAEGIMAYCARVSSSHQDNPDYAGLLKYCIQHKHWSVFEMANLCLEIQTTRAIARQILRHRSFSFQEFSQRYAQVQEFATIKPRRQDHKNRQSSHDDLSVADTLWFQSGLAFLNEEAMHFYQECLKRGIAKESARFALSENAMTRMYMNGSVRSWIHYIQLRTGPETQLEHRDVANEVKKLFCRELPITAEALGWL